MAATPSPNYSDQQFLAADSMFHNRVWKSMIAALIKIHCCALLVLFWLCTAADAQVGNQPFSITVTVNPACTGIALSSTSISTNGPNNANMVVGAVTVTANPVGGNYLGTLTLGGASGPSFALTNGGKLPSNLVVGPSNLTAGSYAITISCN